MPTHLSQFDWLKGLPDTERQAVTSRMATRRYNHGQFVYQRGDSGTEMYQITQGCVRLYSLSSEGKKLLYAVFEPGDFFGEISVLDNKPRHHMAQTFGDVELKTLRSNDFHKLCETYPAIYQAMFQLLCQRSRSMFNYFQEASQMALAERIAIKLCTLARSFKLSENKEEHLDLKVTQEDIGYMVAASRQSVNKVLNDWQQDNAIEIQYGSILIKDFAFLLGKIPKDSEYL